MLSPFGWDAFDLDLAKICKDLRVELAAEADGADFRAFRALLGLFLGLSLVDIKRGECVQGPRASETQRSRHSTKSSGTQTKQILKITPSDSR